MGSFWMILMILLWLTTYAVFLAYIYIFYNFIRQKRLDEHQNGLFCSTAWHCALLTMHKGPYIVTIRTMCITFILYLLHSSSALNPLISCSVHRAGPLICWALARLWPSVSCDVSHPPSSAENKRKSKHAGKSLNPEWNQTVIYKNILLEQVCGPKQILIWLKPCMGPRVIKNVNVKIRQHCVVQSNFIAC